MAIAIRPYTEDLIPAVKAFNGRLACGGVAPEFHFPESNIPYWLRKADGRRIYQEYYLAVDSDFVRGGFILKYQDVFLNGEMRPVVYYHLPVSEGIVNKAYASVGVHLLRSALRMQPMLFALGMGGFDRPLPQMLKAMGWSLCAVPFYFKVHHPARVLGEIGPLRQGAGWRGLADLAAYTGTGWLGIKLVNFMRSRSAPRGLSAERINGFGLWADDLWRRCREHYRMIAVRDRDTLNVLYPADEKFLCIKISVGSGVVGWAVVLDTQMHNNKYFGNLRVGSIVDCLAAPENAAAVIQAATRLLEDCGVDVIVSNESHAAWCDALGSAGFFRAQSNYIFAASKSLAEVLAPFGTSRDQIFLNRGDGDGPVNL